MPIVSSEEYSGRVLLVKRSVLSANKTTANMVVERESSSPGESGKTYVWFIIFDHVSNIQEHFTDNNNNNNKNNKISKSKTPCDNKLTSYNVRENKDIDFMNRLAFITNLNN
jgi:hypothetical protein